jgi:hypothetical protein
MCVGVRMFPRIWWMLSVLRAMGSVARTACQNTCDAPGGNRKCILAASVHAIRRLHKLVQAVRDETGIGAWGGN